MGNWFGKDCKYQICDFEGWYTEEGYEEDKSQPVLVFCNHKDNPDNHEGNCNNEMCPFKACKDCDMLKVSGDYCAKCDRK